MDQVLTIARYTNSLLPCQVPLQRPKIYISWLFPLFPSVDLIVQRGYWSIQLIRFIRYSWDNRSPFTLPLITLHHHPAQLQCSYQGFDKFPRFLLFLSSSPGLHVSQLAVSWFRVPCLMPPIISICGIRCLSTESHEYAHRTSCSTKFPFFHHFLFGLIFRIRTLGNLKDGWCSQFLSWTFFFFLVRR